MAGRMAAWRATLYELRGVPPGDEGGYGGGGVMYVCVPTCACVGGGS